MELYLMELVLGWPDKYLELTRTLLYPEFFNRIYCWSIELIEQEQIKPLKYMIIMRSEGKFLRHFKEAAPLAVSTFGSKIGHLTLRMILYSSSKKVGLVAHHYHHFVRANPQPRKDSSPSSIVWPENTSKVKPLKVWNEQELEKVLDDQPP